jgi:hypothetical protein
VECWKTRGIHTDQDGYSTTGRYIDMGSSMNKKTKTFYVFFWPKTNWISFLMHLRTRPKYGFFFFSVKKNKVRGGSWISSKITF